MVMKIKCGIGFDAHRLVEGRKLIIGGIEIEYCKGLLGHSDADVLIHAIIDALLGAAFGRDIGQLFPDNDQSFKDIDSKILLDHTAKLIYENGFEISNIDSQIIAEAPKMAKHIPMMRKVLAEILKINIDDISIKATSTEKMGFTGRGEGISAVANCLLIKG